MEFDCRTCLKETVLGVTAGETGLGSAVASGGHQDNEDAPQQDMWPQSK